MVKQDRITKQKIEKYYNLTSKALVIAKKSITKTKEMNASSLSEDNEKKAHEIIQMVECYLYDAKHFEKKSDYVNSFACLNYAHGWLDAGARLRIFEVNDNKLFTI